jgi:5-methyltetrahydrofolate--homocysteine methyltransferase
MIENELREAIKLKPLVFEGAYDANLPQFQELAIAASQEGHASDGLLSLSHPELIHKIHQDYVSAGSDVLQTFTWGLHPACFDPSIGDDEIAKAARHHAEIACDVAKSTSPNGCRRWVAGIVPAGVHPLFLQKTNVVAAQSAAGLIARALIAGGADFLLVSLQPSIVDAKAAFDGVEQACKLRNSKPPIFVSFDISPVGHPGPAGLISGEDLERALATFEAAGAFSVGVYLTTHPERLPEAPFRSICRQIPVHVFADAGYTEKLDGRARWSLEPKEYAQIVSEQAKRLGLGFIGGGWGLSPQHICELRLAVDRDKA